MGSTVSVVNDIPDASLFAYINVNADALQYGLLASGVLLSIMANAEEFPLQDLADGLGQVVGFISDGQATTLTVNAEAVDAWSSSIAGSDGDLDYVTYQVIRAYATAPSSHDHSGNPTGGLHLNGGPRTGSVVPTDGSNYYTSVKTSLSLILQAEVLLLVKITPILYHVYAGHFTVWSGATADSDNAYYMSNHLDSLDRWDLNVVEKCPMNAVCSGATVTGCKSPSTFIKNNRCVPCGATVATCSSSGQPLTCAPGYGLLLKISCVPCQGVTYYDAARGTCSCPPNWYMGDYLHCQQCPPGFISDTASASLSQCNCADGMFLDFGTSTCTNCPAHSSTTASVGGSCQCDTATYGWFDSAGNDICVACPAGSLINYENQSCTCADGANQWYNYDTLACQSCPQGSFSTVNTMSCACPDNASFDSTTGSCYCPPGVNCFKCNTGTDPSVPYAANALGCICENPNLSTNLATGDCDCPENTYGTYGDGDSLHCVACGRNSSADRGSREQCICDVGSWLSPTAGCLMCPSGSTTSGDGSTCVGGSADQNFDPANNVWIVCPSDSVFDSSSTTCVCPQSNEIYDSDFSRCECPAGLQCGCVSGSYPVTDASGNVQCLCNDISQLYNAQVGCSACPNNGFLSPDGLFCEVCTAGTYTYPGSRDCVPCGEGTDPSSTNGCTCVDSSQIFSPTSGNCYTVFTPLLGTTLAPTVPFPTYTPPASPSSSSSLSRSSVSSPSSKPTTTSSTSSQSSTSIKTTPSATSSVGSLTSNSPTPGLSSTSKSTSVPSTSSTSATTLSHSAESLTTSLVTKSSTLSASKATTTVSSRASTTSSIISSPPVTSISSSSSSKSHTTSTQISITSTTLSTTSRLPASTSTTITAVVPTSDSEREIALSSRRAAAQASLSASRLSASLAATATSTTSTSKGITSSYQTPTSSIALTTTTPGGPTPTTDSPRAIELASRRAAAASSLRVSRSSASCAAALATQVSARLDELASRRAQAASSLSSSRAAASSHNAASSTAHL